MITESPFGYDLLNVETSGPETGEPIVVLHGWGSSAQIMRPVAEAFSDRYRVYNLDLPGHGHSPQPPVPWGVPEYAGLVWEFVQAHTDRPVTIIGHSNGGRIALYMATHPEMKALIRRLVLISPSGITPKRSAKYYVKKSVANALKAPFQVLPERLRDIGLDWLRHSLVWKMLGSSDYRQLDGVMRETFVRTVNFHLDDVVSRVEVPTLIFWGDRDEAVSRYQMTVLEEKIPDAGLVVLENAGHYGFLDKPDVFIAATSHFLENS